MNKISDLKKILNNYINKLNKKYIGVECSACLKLLGNKLRGVVSF